MLNVKMAYFASINPPVALTGNFRRCSSKRLRKMIALSVILMHVDDAHPNLWKAMPISVRKTSRFFQQAIKPG